MKRKLKLLMMKLLKLASAGFFISMAFSCAVAQSSAYKVTIPLTEDEDGLRAYIVDYDSGAKLDSTVVENSVAEFKGDAANPLLVQLIIDGTRSGMFVLEPGEITGNIKSKTFTGTPLNNTLLDFGKQTGSFREQYMKLAADTNTSPEAKAEFEKQYVNFINEFKKKNTGNPIGYYLFLQDAYELDLPTLDKILAETPQYGKSVRVQKLRSNLVKKSETSVGKKFKDFTVTQPDGTQAKLSDHVGKGHYTLVDFWASWCGPCIRETKVLKELYKEYADKGLEILGVAVWDEPQNTLKAIETHQLPWNQIINAGTIPTDIYGISGIPCIILFDPEGNIVSRDKQDEALVADVKKAMENASAAKTE